jgi:multidrug efflux system membrane fusion protein
VLAQERDGTWVTGLPETVTIITVGQDFVVDGQRVEPVFETAGAP